MKAMTNHHDHHHFTIMSQFSKGGCLKQSWNCALQGRYYSWPKTEIPCDSLDSISHEVCVWGASLFYAENIISGGVGENGGIPGAGIYEANEVISTMTMVIYGKGDDDKVLKYDKDDFLIEDYHVDEESLAEGSF